MHITLASLFVFAILTFWVPDEWPVAIFQTGVFVLAGFAVCRRPRRPVALAWPMAPLSFAVAWGLMQWLTGRASYAFAAKTAIVHWTTLLAVFLIGFAAFREEPRLRWFRDFM